MQSDYFTEWQLPLIPWAAKSVIKPRCASLANIVLFIVSDRDSFWYLPYNQLFSLGITDVYIEEWGETINKYCSPLCNWCNGGHMLSLSNFHYGIINYDIIVLAALQFQLALSDGISIYYFFYYHYSCLQACLWFDGSHVYLWQFHGYRVRLLCLLA